MTWTFDSECGGQETRIMKSLSVQRFAIVCIGWKNGRALDYWSTGRASDNTSKSPTISEYTPMPGKDTLPAVYYL